MPKLIMSEILLLPSLNIFWVLLSSSSLAQHTLAFLSPKVEALKKCRKVDSREHPQVNTLDWRE